MDLFCELNRCSKKDLGNAILVTLATHENTTIKNLARGYSEAEIGYIAINTPKVLLIVARMVIDAALSPPDAKDCPANVKALRRKLKTLFTDRTQLDEFLADPLCPETEIVSS